MTVTVTGQLHGLDAPERVLAPEVGAVIAREWVAGRRPGATPLRTRTHTALYRGPGDVSARVSVELADGEAADRSGEALTLLIRTRDGVTAVSEFPQDPALPSLATMLDPRSALEVLARGVSELSVGPARHADLRCEAALVHHPRTGAAVIRYDLWGPGGRHRQVYAKVYPSVAEARRCAAAHEAVGGRLLRGRGAVVRLPRLVGLDIDTRTVLIESLGGADTRSPAVSPAEAARVLRALHETDAPQDLPETTALDEVDRVRVELAVVRTGWPELAARVAPHADSAADCLEDTADLPGVLSHGDYTPSQLLRMSPDVIGLLDLDTLHRAEPAADLGRYLAYASVHLARTGETGVSVDGGSPRPVAGLGAAVGDLYAVVLDAYGVADGAHPDRVLAHHRLQLALLALRAARRFKEERVHLALALLDTPSFRRTS